MLCFFDPFFVVKKFWVFKHPGKELLLPCLLTGFFLGGFVAHGWIFAERK